MAEDKSEPLASSHRLAQSIAGWEGTNTEDVKIKSGVREPGVARFRQIMEDQKEIDARAANIQPPRPRTLPVEPPQPVTRAETNAAPEDNRPLWLRKQAPILERGRIQAAVGQGPIEPTPTYREQIAQRAVGQAVEQKTSVPATPPATLEQVAARQSLQQGQEIKKRWYDRIPFLKILRGETKPNG